MVNEILAAAGIQARGSRFVKPPAGNYAVWFDSITAEGADGVPPQIFTHDVTIELYTPKPDPAAEKALAGAIGARGIEWTMQDRLWIASEKMYQIIFEFSYIEKRRS